MPKISRFDLFRLYLRSFFIQTGWSYDRMMALGFTWILVPLIKKLCSTAQQQREFLERHLLSFNANPYLANYVLGAVAKFEEDKTAGQQIIRFKDSLRGPLGALGDSLIWQNLRPALLILGLILTIPFGVVGVLSFWLIYNLHQIYLRARGLTKGYTLGLRLSTELTKGYTQNAIKWSGRMGAVLLGILFVLKLNETGIEPFQLENLVLLLLSVLFSFLSFKRNLNPHYTLLILVVSFLVIKAVVGLV